MLLGKDFTNSLLFYDLFEQLYSKSQLLYLSFLQQHINYNYLRTSHPISSSFMPTNFAFAQISMFS
jgi:hypothetical protein